MLFIAVTTGFGKLIIGKPRLSHLQRACAQLLDSWSNYSW